MLMNDPFKSETEEPTKRYHELFNGVACPADSKRYKALLQALETRKFEIEMYWKRATYFWALIAASLIGYGAMTGSGGAPEGEKQVIRCVISALGVLFSFAWVLVNKGSKQWQENWENHVDLLEDAVIGPLHKTVLRRPLVSGWAAVKEVLTGPAAFSVSAINQIISYFTLFVWILLFLRTLPPLHFEWMASVSVEWLVAGVLAASVVLFLWAGRTHVEDHKNRARLRVSRVVETRPEPMKVDEL